MFLFLLLAVPIVEVFVFIEVGLAIGWLPATVLLLGFSLLGVVLLRIEGRALAERLSRALSERRSPGRAALDGALGLLGCILLVTPGFVSGLIGALLLLRPVRTLVRRWLSRQYARRVMSFATSAARFSSGYRVVWPADVESTAIEDDRDQLGA